MGVLDAASTLLAPWMVDIDPKMPARSNNGWSVAQLDANCIYAGYKATDSAVPATNTITWDVALAPGTWTLQVMYVKSASAGVLNFAIDGVTLGTTVDAYAAATTRSQIASITGIPISAGGRHTLVVSVPTKNASSSGFAGFLQHVRFLRTA